MNKEDINRLIKEITGIDANFYFDLNAMREAECSAGIHDTELSIIYKRHLDRVSCSWCATASQRAEAFLRTLNLWENE